MARYWGQQQEESLTTVGGGSENLQGVSASDRKRWDGKQDQLVYDNKPMRGSVNILNSDAVARAFEEFKDAISTAYKQYLSTQVTSYAEMVTAVTNAKNDVDNAYAAIEKYETNMRVLYEDTLSKLTDAQNILAGATTLLNKTNTESSALSAKIKQLESVHSSIISDLGVLRNALANVEKDTDHANIRIEELISKANEVDTHVADLVKTVEDTLAEIETEKEDTLAKIRAVRDSIPEDYEKVCEDVKEVRQELIDARRRGTWITSETVSGEIVHATDCAPAAPLNIKLLGNSEQEQRPGYQLIPFPYADTFTEKNGVIVDVLDDGRIHFYGTATNDFWFNPISETNLVSLPVGDYYAHINIAGTGIDVVRIRVSGISDISSSTAFSVTNEGTTMRSWVGIHSGTTVDAVVELMVSRGSEPKPYEPWVGGESIPNINYSQHIVSAGQKLYKGTNFFDAKTALAKQIELGLCKVNDDGSVTVLKPLNGSNRSFFVSLKAGTYHFKEDSTVFHCLIPNDTYWNGKVVFTEDTEVQCYIYHTLPNVTITCYPRITREEGAPLEPFTNGQPVLVDSGKIKCSLLTENLLNTETCLINNGGFTLPHTVRTNETVWVNTGIFVTKGQVLYDGYCIDGVFTNNYTHYYNIGVQTSSGTALGQTKDGTIVCNHSGLLYLRLDAPVGSVVDKPYLGYIPTTEYVPYAGQSFTALVPGGFKSCGDVADEIDFAEGKHLHYINRKFITRDAYITVNTTNENYNMFVFTIHKNYHNPNNCVLANPPVMCNKFVGITSGTAEKGKCRIATVGDYGWNGDARIYFYTDKTINTIDEFMNAVGDDMYVDYALAEPIITDLTPEEIAQYSKLCMNYPDTLIMNDAGTVIEVEYGKDAEAYINENYTPRSEHEALAQRVKVIEEEIIKL